ncbi:MAG: MOSC domain-containing protein [Alphaproteobacteria bacterium]|nr:MOSC domain-containing protein [Alphaproteobacteria bacterium]
MKGAVIAVSCSKAHQFGKANQLAVRLIKGLGVEGDAHAGETVQHRSRRQLAPELPNLRQVHLMHAEFHDELNAAGFSIGPGVLGENFTTRGIDLLGLPERTLLHIGEEAVVQLTGLRNPCVQIERFQPGLLKACLGRGPNGEPIRKTGVMGVVERSGAVYPGDTIRAEKSVGPFAPLQPV